MKKKRNIYEYAFGGDSIIDDGGKKSKKQLDCPQGDCEEHSLHIPLPNFLKPNLDRRQARADKRFANSDEPLLNEINYPGVGTNRYYPVTSFDPQPFQNGVSYQPNNEAAMGGTAEMIAGKLPDLLNSLMSITDNNSYSRQPIMNASAVRNMVNPYSGGNQYAMGGSFEDLDEGELAALTQAANAQGLDPEEFYDELMQQQGQGQDEDDTQDVDYEDVPQDEDDSSNNLDENPEYKYGGGFKINPAHKGWCTPMTKSTCTGKRKQFAINAKNHFKKHAYGGRSGSPINVEGQEVIKQPGKPLEQVNGPRHEQGGVDKVVSDGTKIYSDRLAIDGVAMNDRKIKREGRLKKLNNLLQTNPTNGLLKNTIKRTSQILQREDKQDMALQNVANKIYQPPQEQQAPVGDSHAYGGYVKKFAYGGIGDDDSDPTLPPMVSSTGYIDPTNPQAAGYLNSIPKYVPPSTAGKAGDMTIGDYVGLVGTGFNAIAPIINTNQNFKNTPRSINRYLGVGQKALDANQSAQGYVAGMRTNANTDLETSANTRYTRNSNNASSISTLNALDTGTDMEVDKARNGINDTYSKETIGLLGDREKLLNTKDQYEAYGQTGADDRNTANIDNYYTNRGQNLVNFGREIQTTGKNLNISHRNVVDANLLSQLSRYGLEFDEDGNVINKRKP